MVHRWLKSCGDLYYLRRSKMDEFGNATAGMTMKGFFNSSLAQTDPEVASAINDELKRQQDQMK